VDVTCETCGPCRQGRGNLCERLQTIGFERDGAYCEFVRVPQGNLHLLPDSISLEEASMIQTMTIAFNAVKRRGEVGVQDRVLIFGGGPIGLCALAVAKVSGAQVYLTDLLDYRLDVARAMGADGVYPAARVDLVKTLLEVTGSKGVDQVIEAAGGEQKATLVQATQLVKRGGVVVVAGTFADDLAPVRINEIKSRELELRGSRGDVDDFPACIDLLASGKVRLDKMISHRLGLEEVEKGLKMMMEKTGNVLKIIMSP
jgi:L-gulonate 5-dehydrogenase